MNNIPAKAMIKVWVGKRHALQNLLVICDEAVRSMYLFHKTPKAFNSFSTVQSWFFLEYFSAFFILLIMVMLTLPWKFW
jgi:hypothetical protein